MTMLHLLDASCPRRIPAACALLGALQCADGACGAVLFGGPPLLEPARLAGLTAQASLAPSLGRPWLDFRAASAAVAPLAPSAITAWSVDALLFARLAFARVPASLGLLENPSAGTWRLIRALHRWRPFELVAPQSLVAGGVLGQNPLPIRGFALPPQPTLSHPPAIGQAAVALVGLNADAWRGASALGIGDVMLGVRPGEPAKHRLLVHPDQTGLAHAKRLVAGIGQPERLVATRLMDTPWHLPVDCRTVLALASPQGPDASQTVALPWLAAQGKRIVAEDDPALRALVGDCASAVWVKAGDIPALAHAVAQPMLS